MRFSRLKLSKKRNIFTQLAAPLLLFFSRFRHGVSLMVFIFLCAFGAVTWQLGYFEEGYTRTITAIFRFLGKLGYTFNDVYVQGRYYTQIKEILGAIKIHHGESIFKCASAEIRESLERLPWVEHAVVYKKLPNQLHIQIKERTPIALWQHQKRFYLVDQNGAIIHTNNIPQTQSLPVIVGTDAPHHAPKLLNLLSHYKEIKSAVTGIVRINRRRWDLILNKNITIKLPEIQVEVALARLNFLLEAKKIKLDEFLAIDLRLPKQLIAKMAPHTASRIKVRGGKQV